MTGPVVISEPVDDRLFVKIRHAHGRVTRWGPDEPDASGIPNIGTISSTAPGGWKEASISLARDPRRDWPDLDLLDEIEIYGRTAPLKRKAFEGQQEQFPSQLGDTMEIAVNAIGFQAALEDKRNFQEIYADGELSRWQPMTRARRAGHLAADISNVEPSVSPDQAGGLPAVLLEVVGPLNRRTIGTATYDAGAAKVGALYHDSVMFNIGAAEWETRLFNGDSADAFSEIRSDFSGSSVAEYVTPATPRRFVHANLDSNGIIDATDGRQFSWQLRKLTVYGNHGLTRRQIDGADPGGFYGHDILGHIVSGAPPLTYEVGRTIAENTSFVVPQLAFLDPTTRAHAVAQLNAYFLWNWAVWERKEFWWHPWDPGALTWKARIQGGAHWAPAGRQASTLFNGVVVSYNDISGQRRTAGPPGSGCDTESELLQDTSPANPVTRHGRTRWELLDVGFPLTGGAAGSAVQIGYVWMREHAIPQRRGTLVVKPLGPGHIPQLEHPTAGPLPIWACRPGDFAELVDFPDREPFKVIDASYDHQTKTGTYQLDNSALKLAAIFERVGIRSQGAL